MTEDPKAAAVKREALAYAQAMQMGDEEAINKAEYELLSSAEEYEDVQPQRPGVRTCEGCHCDVIETSDNQNAPVVLCATCSEQAEWRTLVRQAEIVGARAVLASDWGGEPEEVNGEEERLIEAVKELAVMWHNYSRKGHGGEAWALDEG